MTTYTDAEYETYIKVKYALLEEDARNYVRDYLYDCNIELTDEQFEAINFGAIVFQYEEHFDHFDPTADAWQNIVSDYLEDYDFEGGAE